MPGTQRPARIRRSPLRHQYPIVAIERHHVGYGSERDQVEQVGRAKFHVAQFPRERNDHIERHTDAGQRRAGEDRTPEVRIHDNLGARQRLARQVMIGHEHRNAQGARCLHSLDARHAVVDGDDQRGLARRRQRNDFLCQAITEAKSIGDQKIHMAKLHRTQGANHERAARRPIRIEITDHQNPSLTLVRCQQPRRCFDPVERTHRQQSVEGKIKLIGA